MHRYILTLLLLLGSHLAFSAQPPQAIEPIEKITLLDGLSNNRATALLEDSRGYLWVGSVDGLNRYNGHNITSYKNGLHQQRVSSNRILSLAEDSHSNIWIGTEEGITIYDYRDDKFTILEGLCADNRPLSSVEITDIYADKNGIYCLTLDAGLLVYDNEYNLLRCDTISNHVATDLEPLDDDRLIIISNRNIIIYNIDSGAKQRILVGSSLPIMHQITRIDNTLYVITQDGIMCIAIENEGGEESFTLSQKRYFRGRKFNIIHSDSRSGLWFGGLSEGLYYIEDIRYMGHYHFDGKVEPRAIAEGDDGRLWVGMSFYGVNRYSVKESPFDFVDTRQFERFNLWRIDKFDETRALLRYNEGRYILYDSSRRRFSSTAAIEALDSLSYISPQANGEHYAFVIGARGLELLKYRNNGWRKMTDTTSSEDRPDQIPLEVKHDGEYLWALYTYGLYRIELKHDSYAIQKIPLAKGIGKNLRLRSLTYDPASNTMWIATSLQGIYRINNCRSKNIFPTQILHYFYHKGVHEQLPTNSISAIVVDSARLWIGTNNGLCRADVVGDSLRVKSYDMANGLPSNVIKAVLTDDNNRLWISTDAGLSRMTKDKERFRNFATNNGLTFVFFSNAATRFNASQLMFGAPEGITLVNPNKKSPSPTIPKLQIDDFHLFNRAVHAGQSYDGEVIYQHRLESGDRIKLKYDQNIFSINAYAMGYSSGGGYSFRYRIIGANNQWIYRKSNEPMISFSGLHPGNYRLEIAASNGSGAWGEALHLDISIAPPFYLSSLAYILYLLLIVAAIYAIMRIALNIQSLHHALQIESINKRDADDKQRYFLNIAHEINTPLSLVVSANATLYERYNHDEDISKQLHMVSRQVRKISSMIDTVQSVELNELGLLVPKFSCFEFNKFIATIVDDFGYIADSEGKTITMESPKELIHVKADLSMIEKVLSNLLNNAFKYSLKGDSVAVSWRAEGAMVVLAIRDSGIGISQQDLPHIFDRYYRASGTTPKGTGIGLSFSRQLVELHGGFIEVESELGHGARFIITMPIVTDDAPAEALRDELMLPLLGDIPDGEGGEFAASRIFLVEDDGQIRQYLDEFLSRHFSVSTFADGAECLERMEHEWPELIISDFMMANVDGYELCRRVKGNINTSHIPFMLLTACTSLDHKIKCHEAGADSYITKPFYPQYLLTCIESLLRNYKNMQERFVIGTPLSMPSGEQSEQNNEFMERLYKLLDDNLDMEEIDYNLFTRELCVNRTLFFQKVKSLTGKTPYELIKEYRLIRAATWLAKDGLTIEEVCLRVGFKSRTHFSKLFKDKFGVPPSKYTGK